MAPAQTDTPLDWGTCDGSGFVPVHDRRMFLSVRGPPRVPGQPVVICEAGLGDASYGWTAVQSLAAEFIRVFAYDRAGLGQSDPGPGPRTASVIAKDLSDLVGAANIPGPFIVVAHSYGGMMAREFLDIRSDDVAGLICVDTITERYLSEGAIPEEELATVSKGLDFWEVSGIAEKKKIGPKEWELVTKRWPNDTATSGEEFKMFPTSEKALAAKKQFERRAMGDRPVVVIKGKTTRDVSKVLEAGTAAGNGTEKQRAVIRKVVETAEPIREKHQREQMQLSTKSRYVAAQNSGHNVHLTEPELIVAEIKTMLQNLGCSQ